jgi:hypothetical protein
VSWVLVITETIDKSGGDNTVMEEVGKKLGVEVIARGAGGKGEILKLGVVREFLRSTSKRKGSMPSKVLVVPDIKGIQDEPSSMEYLRKNFSITRSKIKEEFACDLCVVFLENSLERFMETCLPTTRRENYKKSKKSKSKFEAAKEFAPYMEEKLIQKANPLLVNTVLCRACPD